MTSAADWSGTVGGVWADEWRRTDRSFAGLSHHLDAAILAAAPDRGAAIDIGCGAGATSIALASARQGLAVTGIDIAHDLVAIARRRAAGLDNARFLAADLNRSVDGLPAADLFFSRHGVMFFDDPGAAFAALRRVAKPGAALVFSCFRDPSLNPWASDLVEAVTGAAPQPAAGYAPGPFAFADRAFVADLLARAGWHGAKADPVDYRYVAGAGDDPLADAVSFLRRIGPIARALRDVPDARRAAMLDKLAAALQKHREIDEIAFPAAAWIWRARAAGERA